MVWLLFLLEFLKIVSNTQIKLPNPYVKAFWAPHWPLLTSPAFPCDSPHTSTYSNHSELQLDSAGWLPPAPRGEGSGLLTSAASAPRTALAHSCLIQVMPVGTRLSTLLRSLGLDSLAPQTLSWVPTALMASFLCLKHSRYSPVFFGFFWDFFVLMWIIFKVFTEFVKMLLLLYVLGCFFFCFFFWTRGM